MTREKRQSPSPNRPKPILGLDPGTRITGYGVIGLHENGSLIPLDYGCIRPPVSKPLPYRYRVIFELIVDIIDRWEPEAIAVETQYIHKKNPKTGLTLGKAWASCSLPGLLREIPLFEYSPTQAKRAVVGNGNASKEQVQAMVQRLLGLQTIPTPNDTADALALAICLSHSFGRGGYIQL